METGDGPPSYSASRAEPSSATDAPTDIVESRQSTDIVESLKYPEAERVDSVRLEGGAERSHTAPVAIAAAETAQPVRGQLVQGQPVQGQPVQGQVQSPTTSDIQVPIPPQSRAGDMLLVTTHSGRQLEVTVPPNAGAEVTVTYARDGGAAQRATDEAIHAQRIRTTQKEDRRRCCILAVGLTSGGVMVCLGIVAGVIALIVYFIIDPLKELSECR